MRKVKKRFHWVEGCALNCDGVVVALVAPGDMVQSLINLLGDIMQVALATPLTPVGKIKSFGPLGPRYEVGQPLRQLADGDWMVEVTLIETGEKAEYRLTHLNDDPEAR